MHRIEVPHRTVGYRSDTTQAPVHVCIDFTPERAQTGLLVDILETADDLARHPQWYNTITDNCTTSLARHIRKLSGRRRWDPRLLLNGHTDEMGLESGWLTPHGDLEETRRHYHVNPKVDRIQDPTDYSRQIRQGL